MISQENLNEINDEIDRIAPIVRRKLTLKSDIQKIKDKLLPKIKDDSFVSGFLIQIYGIKDLIFSPYNDTQMVPEQC